MAGTGEIWTPPGAYPASPSVDGDEGFPIWPGYSGSAIYHDTGLCREAKRIEGVRFIPHSDPWTVEGAVTNDAMKILFRAMRRAARLEQLLTGLSGLAAGMAGDGYPNFNVVLEATASGSGTSIPLTWPSGDGPSNLGFNPDSGSAAIQPFLWFASPTSDGSICLSQVMDFAFTGTNSGTLSLLKPIDASAGTIYLIREYPVAAWPTFNLRLDEDEVTDPLRCAYCVKLEHSIFSSFKTYFPDAYCSDGIDGAWYCVKMNAAAPAPDMSEFHAVSAENPGGCSNTDCPLYMAHVASIPLTETAIRAALLGGGLYLKTTMPGPIQVLGRNGILGLFAAMGFRIGYSPSGATNPQIGWVGRGALKQATGETVLGWEAYRTWDEWQTYRVANSLLEQDAVGDYCTGALIAKQDPLGGAFNDDAARTPGAAFEKWIGLRRIGQAGYDSSWTLSGNGDAEIQRVRPRRYSSPWLTLPHAAGTETDDETSVAFLASPVTIGAVEYDIAWTRPRFGETTAAPETPAAKSGGTVANGSLLYTNRLYVEFALGELNLVKDDGGTDTFDCAGNVVRGDNAWEPYGEGASRGFGDRQSGLFPGDIVTFAAEAVAGLKCVVLSAQAFGGSADTGATAPNAGTPRVPQYVRDNYNKRDCATIGLFGLAGQTVYAWVDGGGLASPVALATHTRGPASPPPIDYEGFATAYAAPVVKYIAQGGSSATALTVTTDYVDDPTAGILYLRSAALPASGTVRLYYDGWAVRIVRDYIVETAEAFDAAVEFACQRWATLELPTPGSLTVYTHNITKDTYGGGFWFSGKSRSGSFSGFSGMSLSPSPEDEGDSVELVWQKAMGGSALYAGIAASGFWETNGTALASDPWLINGLYSVTVIPFAPLAMPAPGEIAGGKLYLTVADGATWISSSSNAWFHSDPETHPCYDSDYTPDGDTVSPSWGCMLVSLPSDWDTETYFEDGAIVPLTEGVDLTWNYVDLGGGSMAYRGTADVTALLAAAAGRTGGEETTLAILFYPTWFSQTTKLGANATDMHSLMEEAIGTWIQQSASEEWCEEPGPDNDPPGVPYDMHMYISGEAYSGGITSLGTVKVQFDTVGMDSCAVPHFDNAGQVNAPNLKYEPT